MNQAYVLINSATGFQEIAFESLKQLSFVKEIYKVYGAYDIALKIEEESHQDIKDFVANHIRNIEGVGSTLTMMLIG